MNFAKLIFFPAFSDMPTTMTFAEAPIAVPLPPVKKYSKLIARLATVLKGRGMAPRPPDSIRNRPIWLMA